MKRPLVFMTLYFVIGIIVGRYVFETINIVFLLFSVIISCVIINFYKKWLGVYSFIIFFVLGVLLCRNNLYFCDDYIHNISLGNKEVILKGEVLDVDKTSSNKPKVLFKITSILNSNEIYNLNIKMQAFLNEFDKVSIGEVVKIKGEIIELEQERNPGGYNELISLYGKNIKYKIFGTISKDKEKNKLFNYYKKTNTENELINFFKNKNVQSDFQKLETEDFESDYSSDGIKKSFNFYMKTIRDRFSLVYDNVLPKKEAGIIKAMVIGDEREIDEELKNIYVATGIYHIISVSGTHIAIIAVIFLYILRKFLSDKIAYIILLVFIIFYGILTGASPSGMRAVIMYSLFIFGYLIFRKSDLLNTLCFSALCILIYQPIMLWNIGFQLSFGAVFGIAFCNQAFGRAITLISKYKYTKFLSKKWLSDFLSVFLSVNLFTSFISCFYFYYVTPYSLIVNFIVFPTASIILGLGLFIGIVGLFTLKIALLFSGTIYFILKFYEYVCLFFVSLPFSNILIGEINFFSTTFYFLISFAFVKMFMSFNEKFNYYKKIFLYATISFFIINQIILFLPKNLKITMLDIGQGDCFVISHNNKNIVIDCGEKYYPLFHDLDRNKIKLLDAVFVTHTDADHISGIIELTKYKKIKNIFLPPSNYENDDLYNILKINAEENNIKVHFIKSDDIINIDENLDIKCLHPFDNKDEGNNSSLVLKITYAKNNSKVSALFMGDLEGEKEKFFLNSEEIKSDILKISHHGSKNSSSEEFINKVSPTISLISVGKNNRYGHPNKDVLERLTNVNCSIYRTDINGAVILETDAKKFKIKKILKKGFCE